MPYKVHNQAYPEITEMLIYQFLYSSTIPIYWIISAFDRPLIKGQLFNLYLCSIDASISFAFILSFAARSRSYFLVSNFLINERKLPKIKLFRFFNWLDIVQQVKDITMYYIMNVYRTM